MCKARHTHNSKIKIQQSINNTGICAIHLPCVCYSLTKYLYVQPILSNLVKCHGNMRRALIIAINKTKHADTIRNMQI